MFKGLEWRCIGPFRGGRSATVTGVQGKPNLYYFGSTGGGVWKTLDGGQNWQNISDGYFGGSIGAVEVAASDPNVIYAGGGEQTVRGNVSSGHGIWKTMDAGETWEHMGLDQARHIPRIRIHPHNPDIVFAAVLGDIFKDSPVRGIYKSMDGGKSWRQTLFVNNRTGAVDLIIDPVNPRILYASTWHVERKPYELSSGGDQRFGRAKTVVKRGRIFQVMMVFPKAYGASPGLRSARSTITDFGLLLKMKMAVSSGLMMAEKPGVK